MFDSLGRLVNRHGLAIVLIWLTAALVLWWVAPDWHSVTKDDDVSFFPPEYPSVVGQGLLARGFPDGLSNSSVVLLAERPEGRLTLRRTFASSTPSPERPLSTKFASTSRDRASRSGTMGSGSRRFSTATSVESAAAW